MAYRTYTTDALVCGTFDRNTADRSYRLFTRSLGMVWADARSVRQEKSRQRMALTDFSLVRVSLVRGKVSWKIGSVVPISNFYHQAANQAARGSVRNVVRTLTRFLAGEEPQPVLFGYAVEACAVLTDRLEHPQVVEAFVMVEILRQLGYVSVSQIEAVVGEAAGGVVGGMDKVVAQGRPAALLPAALVPAQLSKLQALIKNAERASQL